MAIVITTTSDNHAELVQIAKQLVDQQLAACCQIIGPITSFYRWQSKIEECSEWMCCIKTTPELYHAVEIAIRQQHHSEEPEIIATEIVQGSAGYLGWIAANTLSQ